MLANHFQLIGEQTIQIREMRFPDVSDVLTIEQDSFEKPWSKSKFDYLLNLLTRRHKSAGIVAEQDDQIIGFVMYEKRLGKIRILDYAVGRRGPVLRAWREFHRQHGQGIFASGWSDCRRCWVVFVEG